MSPQTRIATPVASVGIFLALGATCAHAFCLQPQPIRVCAEFFKADEVFTGTIISAQYMEDHIPEPYPDPQPGWHYRLKVLKNFRGPARGTVDVYTENTSGRFPLDLDKSYLLFAYKSGSILQVYGCLNSVELTDAGTALAEIRRLLSDAGGNADGSIRGCVVNRSGGVPLGGISLTARSSKRKFLTQTGPDGWFDLRVPPGKYNVAGSATGWTVTPYDVSFDDPSAVKIESGGCADVQFGATRNSR